MSELARGEFGVEQLPAAHRALEPSVCASLRRHDDLPLGRRPLLSVELGLRPSQSRHAREPRGWRLRGRWTADADALYGACRSARCLDDSSSEIMRHSSWPGTSLRLRPSSQRTWTVPSWSLRVVLALMAY